MNHPDDWSDDEMLSQLIDDIGCLIVAAVCIVTVIFVFAIMHS